MGAPIANKNALRYGGHSTRKIDGRSTEAIATRRLRANLETDLGGRASLSCQEQLIVERIVKKALILNAIETYAMSRRIFKKNGDLIGCLGKSYLAWAAEMRRDLQAVGLKRRLRDVTLNEMLKGGQR